MSDFFNTKHVKTRKKHQCAFCAGLIPKGTKTYFCDGMHEGDFMRYYLCGFCEHFIHYWDDYEFNDEGFDCMMPDYLYLFDLCNCKHTIYTGCYMIDNMIEKESIKITCEICEEEKIFKWKDVLKRIKTEKGD